MHICFITSEYPMSGYPHGGIGAFVKTISQKLVEVGHKVSVLGINTYTEKDIVENDQNVTIYRLKPRKVKGLTWWFNNQLLNQKLAAIHNENTIDVVETAELGLAFLKKNKSIRYIIRLHGGHHFFAEAEHRKISFWRGFQEKRSFKKADAFIAVSNFVKTHTEKYLSYNNKPLRVIKSPINLDVFKPKPDIVVEPFSILFAGTVCEKKGVRHLINAMPKVLDQYPEMNLYIYGRDWFFKDGRSYINYLEEEVLPGLKGLHKNIHFMGAVPMTELVNKYASAEVCIFPSLMETQGLVAPEAMAVKKLVIFSECGPGPETITHGETGLLCNPYNESDIAEQIIWALNNKDDAEIIADNGYDFATKNFNPEIIIHENTNYYKQISDS